MRKIIYISIVFCFSVPLMWAQQKISVDLNQQPIITLFDLIKSQTNYEVYYIPREIDSLIVSVHEINGDPIKILQQAIQDTSFQVTEYDSSIFILKDKRLITALPEDFYRTQRTDSIELPVISLADNKQEEVASSEHKVYNVGNEHAPPVSKVTLTGYVTDFRTGETISGITVFIESPQIATITDGLGYYSIQLPWGRQELIIRGMGMKKTKRQLMLYSNGKLNIELEEQVYSLQEVVILSERANNIKATAIGVEHLRMKSIKNIPTAFGEADIVQIVLKLPGVKSVGEISSGFNVRGGATDQNLILYNDGTVYNPTHLFGLFSTFNPDVVSDMELYKSSIPAKYGGRISSVWDINGREGNKKNFQGSASIGLLTSRLTLEGPLLSEKTSFIVGGRATYSDWLLGLIPEKSGFSDASAGFYDINGSISHKFDEHNAIYLNAYYSYDRFRFNAYEQYAYQNVSVSGKWRHIFNPKLISTLVAGYDQYGYDTENTENTATSYTLDFKINQIFGKADFAYYLNDCHTLNAGINSIFYNLQPGNYLPNGEESLIREEHVQTEKSLESAIYVGDQWKISPNLSIDAGVRYSIFNVLGPRIYNTYSSDYLPSLGTILATDSVGRGMIKTYHGPEFRFSFRYAFGESMSVKAGVNTMRQYIHKISNNTIMSPTDTWKLSDVNILPQTGTQFAAGFFKNFANNAIETSIEGYYKMMNNYPDYRIGAELLMSHHLETEIVGTKGKAYGVELMVKKIQGRLNGWISYTYSRTLLHRKEETSSGGNSDEWYPADFDKPHEVKFVSNYKFTHRYSFSLNCDYNTGRPITLPVAKYPYAGGQAVYYADRNQHRVPDFFRVDIAFNIEAGHRLTKLTHSSLSFGVYNLTGRKNAYSIYYVAEDGKINGYKLSIFGVPIPYISYNIKF